MFIFERGLYSRGRLYSSKYGIMQRLRARRRRGRHHHRFPLATRRSYGLALAPSLWQFFKWCRRSGVLLLHRWSPQVASSLFNEHFTPSFLFFRYPLCQIVPSGRPITPLFWLFFGPINSVYSTLYSFYDHYPPQP